MTRILVIVPFALAEEDIAKRREQTVEVQLRPGVSFDFRPVAAGPTSFMSPHDWALMDLAIFEAGLSAEEDGYDGVLIDTVSDSGTDALRSMLDIPVLAPGKASLLFALSLGRKFGILAQWEPALTRYRKVIDEWGFAEHCAGVEHFDTPPDFAGLIGAKADTTLPKMKSVCRRLIDQGADVICLGSTTMHEAHRHLSAALEVPVVNPGPLSYKLMESMLALRLTHSRVAYPRPQVAKAAMIHAMQEGAAMQQQEEADGT